MRADRANDTIENFGQIAQIAAEEGKATARGTISYFGIYAVSEVDRTMTVHVEASSFSNWNGTDQKRIVEVRQDQLKLIVRPPRGGSVDVVCGSGRGRSSRSAKPRGSSLTPVWFGGVLFAANVLIHGRRRGVGAANAKGPSLRRCCWKKTTRR
jgi:hypothetical protein